MDIGCRNSCVLVRLLAPVSRGLMNDLTEPLGGSYQQASQLVRPHHDVLVPNKLSCFAAAVLFAKRSSLLRPRGPAGLDGIQIQLVDQPVQNAGDKLGAVPQTLLPALPSSQRAHQSLVLALACVKLLDQLGVLLLQSLGLLKRRLPPISSKHQRRHFPARASPGSMATSGE